MKTSQCVKFATTTVQLAPPNKQMLSNKIGDGVKLIVLKDMLQSDRLFHVAFAGFDKECFLMEDIGNLYYCTDFV